LKVTMQAYITAMRYGNTITKFKYRFPKAFESQLQLELKN